jgi:hypothetical protein
MNDWPGRFLDLTAMNSSAVTERACPDGRAPYVPTAVEPRYVGTSFSSFYDSNIISVVSLNDFSGDVRLEVLSLPDWVRSQTATKG